MKKRFLMRIASLAAVCAIFTGTALMPAVKIHADTITSAEAKSGLKDALAAAKRISIPEHLTEFGYTVKKSCSTICYVFTWTTPSNAEKYQEYIISVSDGNIVYFYKNKDEKNDVRSFAKLSEAELLSKAKEHMKKLNPDLYKKGVYSISGIKLFGSNAQVEFQRKENGIEVSGNGARIELDKNTGELLEYEMSWWNNAEFESADKVLSDEKLKESIKKLCKLTPVYYINNDYSTGKAYASYVYIPEYTGEVDAATGKASSIWSDMVSEQGTVHSPTDYNFSGKDRLEDTEAGVDGGGTVNYTEAELKEIEKEKSLLSTDKITAMLKKDKYVDLYEKAELKEYKLVKNNDTGEYFYKLSYTSGNGSIMKGLWLVDEQEDTIYEESYDEKGNVIANATNYSAYVFVNALTGKVEDYSRSCEDSSYSGSYPTAENLKIAKSVLKHFCPDTFGEFRSIAANNPDPKAEETGPFRMYEFQRYKNGVKVTGDTVTVNISAKGEVTYFNCSYTDIEFPEAQKLDEKKAYASLFKQLDMSVYYDGYYKPDGTVKSYLVCKIDSFKLNTDYKFCNSKGVAVTPAIYKSTDYSDIDGHKNEAAIRTLAKYGVILECENRKFNPDSKLTDVEFAEIAHQVTKITRPYAIKDNAAKSKALTLTKALAAKVIVSGMGLDEAAKLKGIYKSPYSDVKENDEYVGYISIAKAMGIFKSGGKFEPDKKLTRGEAMQLIYDYITALS